MNGIPAMIRHGQVELAQPIAWPDGTPVAIVPLKNGERESNTLKSWPPGFFETLRQAWGDEPLERPPQGEYEQREDW